MSHDRATHPVGRTARAPAQRGSVLITALLIAAGIALAIGGYLRLSTTSMRLAHRSFLMSDALSVAEGGLEQAIYCFNQLSRGTAAATAWADWTLSGSAAMRTFPAMNRDRHAVAVLKVYVHGYNGSVSQPYVIAQATLTPFDGGAPIVKLLRCTVKYETGTTWYGLVGLNGLTMKGKTDADSFNSNPTNSPTGPWRAYSLSLAGANSRVIVPAGSISIANGKIYGTLMLGPAVTPPPASEVVGTIRRDFTGTYRLPAYPSAAAVSRSYNLGSTIPAALPAAGHLPASDGNYYYFCSGTTIGALAVATDRNIVIVGTNTRMTDGLNLQGTATCSIYIDGPVDISGSVNNGSWAGALRIFTSTTENCSVENRSQIVACIYAPNAELTAKGSQTTNRLVGTYLARTIVISGQMDFHYDEALMALGNERTFQVTQWMELQSSTDRAAVASLTSNYLP